MSPIDIGGGLFAQVQEADQKARHAWNEGVYTEAARQWRIANRLMQQYAQYGGGDTVKRMRLERAEQFLASAHKADERTQQAAAVTVTAVAERTGGGDYQGIIEGLITTVDVRWADIGGLAETKATIQANYALALAQPPPGVQIRAQRTLLLYGPPGTGKTMLAAAASKELDATFFNARVPDLLSQYFGESSKLVSALFATAATHAPSVVFLDEIDALSRQRGGGQESGAERRLLNTLLGELDGLQHKGGDQPMVMTIGATNLPWELDRAILSRFSSGAIYVPLPDDDARRQMLDLYIARRGHTSQIGIEELVRKCAGYSGREIERLIALAVSNMLRRANPTLLQQAANGRDAVRNFQLRTEPLARNDFEGAFAQVKPSTSAADVHRYATWQAD